MQKLTTIQLEKQTREELKKYGYKDETYDEIVLRLIELAKRQMFIERQNEILKSERFVSLEKI